ncbi:uncharacterized protein [Antedon mediterranea]|uniref:uncharacterized protein n=1 Tax=Antedon mediterranea TaxID=105859 RepID=UPI003AF5AAC5
MLKITKIKLKITEMTEIDDDSDPRRRSRKRNFNSWDSDDELLQDDLLIKKTKGDQSDDELDEAALLGLSDSEDNAWNDDTTTTNDELPLDGNGTDHIDSLTNTEEEEFISNVGKFNNDDDDETEVDDFLDSSKDHTVPSQLADKTFDSVVNGSGTEDVLDIDITNEAFDDFDEDLDATTESNFKGEPEKETQERYEEPIQEKTRELAEDDNVKVDTQEEPVEENIDDANKSESSESEEEEEDEKEESGRGRFKSERQPSVAVKPSVRSKRDIPETLELSQEAKEKLDEFNRKKEEEKQSKRNRRGGRGGYGHQRGNQQRGGFSQRGGRCDNFQTCGPGGDNIGNLSRMRFPCRPILNHDRRRNLPQGGPQIGPQGVPMGMNPTMFDQQEQRHIRPQMHQPRPPLMQNPPLIQTPPRQPTPHQRLPMHPPSSSMSAVVHKSEPNQQPNKIHINPHFKGTVQVSSQGQTWNNQNQQVPGIVTSSTTNVPGLPNQNRAPENYINRQQESPVSSWTQAPRLTPSQTWTNPQQGQQHYRDHQPAVSSSHNFNAPSHHFSPPSQRVPDNQMPQQNSFQPRMQQPHQMRPPIPNQQHRPRAEFHTPQQQPNYRPQQQQPRFTTPPMHQQQHQHSNQHRPHLLNQPGMNLGQTRPRFPGPPQGPGQNYRQPSPQFRHQTPSSQKKAPPNYSSPPSSSPNLGSPQRTNLSPSPKQSPKLAAPPQTLIKEAVNKSSVAVPHETNEDAETKRLRIQIEEQKKLREEIMKRKEERRQQLAAKRQEALKKRLAEQGHDVAEATKKLGLDPAPPAKQPANKAKKTPDGKKQGGGTPTKKLEQQMRQKLNQQQEQYAQHEYQQSQPKGYQAPQHQPKGYQLPQHQPEGHRQHQPDVYQHQPVVHRQPQPQPEVYQQPHTYLEPHHQLQDTSVKVWKQQQNLKVLVDEPRPIPTVGNQPAPMPTPQRTNTPPTNMRGHPVRGRGRGRGRGFQHHQNQHQNNPTQNQQPFQQNFPPQQTGLQPVPVNQFQSPGYPQQNIVPQQVQQTRGGGNMRGRGVRGTGRGRGQQRGGSSHQPPARQGNASAGRGNFPGTGRGLHQPHQQQTPGNIQHQPAPARKSVKDRLGGAVTPNHQIHQQVPPSHQQRVVIPPGQNIEQFQQRQQQVNHLEGARLVQTEAILNRVLIEGLSASTVTQGIIQMAKTVGSVQNCHFIPNQRKAFVTFHNPQHAYMFQKKYNRHMVDLSMINVSLIPAT